MKRVLCLLLCLLMLGCQPARKAARAYLSAPSLSMAVERIPFEKMDMGGIDPALVKQAAEQAVEAAKTEDEKTAIRAYETACQSYSDLVSASTLAYIHYCGDVTDGNMAKRYEELSEVAASTQYDLAEAEMALMDRFGYGGRKEAAHREELVLLLRENTPTMALLRQKESELCRRYEQLESQCRVELFNRSWSMGELMEDETLSFREFFQVMDAWSLAYNGQAAEIFLSLMAVRKQMAAYGGQSTFAARQYEAYGRCYTPEEALLAAQTVKQVLSPLYERMREECANEFLYLSGAIFSEDAFLGTMGRAAEQVVRGAGGVWNQMLSLGLYDSVPSPHKIQGSFTTYIGAYRSPFLFTQWEDSATDVFTVIHEFGHFLSYFLNPEGTYYGSENLDLAETDAQTFELLMTEAYAPLFGRYQNAARLCLLTNALYAILSGCMEDEFQQLAYAMDDPSQEKLNELYGRLAHEYGFDALFGYEGTEWTHIHHTFSLPFYYVSYSTSMLAAVRLYEQGTSGMRKLLNRHAEDDLYVMVGGDLLSEANIRQTAVFIESTFENWLQEA